MKKRSFSLFSHPVTCFHSFTPVLLTVMLLISCPAAYAADVSLAWDAPDASAPAGYKVYYGTAAAAYTNNVDAGNMTRCTIKGLAEGKTYYFAATAYYPGGVESGFSNQAVKYIPASDTDADGIPDNKELTVTQTDPENADTDGDGLTDGDEVNTYGSDPRLRDSDGDGLVDGDEVHEYGTDINNADTDDDGYLDGEEVHVYHTDPADRDSDGDGIPDGRETRSVMIQAESGEITSPMTVRSIASVPGGAYIKTTRRNKGTAAYSFRIDQPGIYHIKAMVLAKNPWEDSFYVSIDQQEEFIWDLNPSGNPHEFGTWREDNVACRGRGTYRNPQYDPFPVRLTAGLHSIVVRGRERSAGLDYLYFEKIGDLPNP